MPADCVFGILVSSSNRAGVRQKIQVGMCAHRRPRSACASAQSRSLIRVMDGHFMGSQGSNIYLGGKLRICSAAQCLD